jgi:PhnB protein
MSRQPLSDQLDQAITGILSNPVVRPLSDDATLQELFAIARDLDGMPRPDFKARLETTLVERGAEMSQKTANEQTVREQETTTDDGIFRPGFRTLTPYLSGVGAERVIDFIKEVFDGEESARANIAPGRFHAEMRVGDSMLMIGGNDEYEGVPWRGELQVYVPDADATYQRALDAGAESLAEMADSRGDRFGAVRDAFGNRWYISTRMGGHYIPEGQQSVTTWIHTSSASGFIDFMIEALGAEVTERHDSPEGLVMHAKIQIGNSVFHTSEAHDWWQPMPTMMYMTVPDADAVYERAIAAGAKSIMPPTDQAYGDRQGGVEDPFGNQWYMSTPIRSPE